MIVIGERINSSIKRIEDAIKAKDTKAIQQEVRDQVHAGADVIDINAGVMIKSEAEDLIWLIQTVNATGELDGEVRLALDTSNPMVIEACLDELNKRGKAEQTLINSVTAEKDKLDLLLPLVKTYKAQLVGLCMNEKGIPEDPAERCKLGLEILKHADEHEIPKSAIYLDPLVLPVSTDIKKGVQVLEAIRLLKAEDPEILTVVGLSNISYGLPEKNLLNRTFLVQAMAFGLDAAIINPMDKQLMIMIKAANVLLAKDDFCMKYISAYRSGGLTG